MHMWPPTECGFQLSWRDKATMIGSEGYGKAEALLAQDERMSRQKTRTLLESLIDGQRRHGQWRDASKERGKWN